MSTEKKARVLFFAWGDSIHARRRIGVFTADAAFEVGVVTNFAYDFENAHNYYLLAAGKPVARGWFAASLVGRLAILLAAVLMHFLLLVAGKRVRPGECRRALEDLLLARRYVAQFAPDVIFLQTLMYPSYLTYFLGKGIPSMVTFWNGDVTWWAQWTGLERAFKRSIVRHGSRRAAAVTVNSNAARDACLEYGVQADRIHLIRYPGVNLELFNPGGDAARQQARERLGLDARKLVLCPRGLGDYLNSDVIVEAAARVLQQHADCVFLFMTAAGGEDIWDQHLARARELGIAHSLARVGKVNWQDMPDYYRAADVVVSIASKDSLPNCMLESMACGIPLVMGDIPQIADWVEDGKNGYLVPPRDEAALAARLIQLLDEGNCVAAGFVRHNLELVKREVDSLRVAQRIKRLVQSVAAGTQQPQQEGR